MNTDLKNETQAEPVSATVQSGSVSIPFWVIDYAQKIELFMKVNGVDAWALGGIQSRDFPPAPQPQAEPVGEWVMVPREPTDAMTTSAYYEADVSTEVAAKAWAAMLAAAPQPQASAEDVRRVDEAVAEDLCEESWEAWQRIRASLGVGRD